MRMRLLLPSIMLALLLLQGCAPAFVAGTASGISLAVDRRTMGTIVEDQSIEIKAAKFIHTDSSFADTIHVVATSFNNVVLLTGQAPNKITRNKIVQRIKKIEKVRRVHNEIIIAIPTTLKTRTNDTWLTTKFKRKLLGQDGINGLQIKVVTENSVVFLMGIVTRHEGKLAASTAQSINGINGVVKVFEYTR